MVQCVKLLSGEEIIGEAEFEADLVRLTKVFMIALIPNEKRGTYGIAFVPFLPYRDERKPFEVYRNAIASVFSPSQQLLNEYNARFGSGIVVASAGAVPTADTPEEVKKLIQL